jgi:MORN repeat protein
MKIIFLAISFVLISGLAMSQEIDTFLLKIPIHGNKVKTYTRIIDYNAFDSLYHVQDYYTSGQIQMEGTYSRFDKNIKEESWCNYATNTKEGEFKKWYRNGQLESKSNFSNGLRNGLFEYWYPNGERESVRNFKNGQDHGSVTYWDATGNLLRKLNFENGLNQNPIDTNYHYISYTPTDYNTDTLASWPLIIYLHGGSSRGTDTIDLFCCGIPDQIWRKRSFPFIIVAPQCPVNHRWSTDNWFEEFYDEITTKYRVDTQTVFTLLEKVWEEQEHGI